MDATLDAREWHPGRLRRTQADQGSKLHIAVDTLGYLLAARVTPASAQDRDQVAERSFAWVARFRRLVKDYERATDQTSALTTLLRESRYDLPYLEPSPQRSA